MFSFVHVFNFIFDCFVKTGHIWTDFWLLLTDRYLSGSHCCFYSQFLYGNVLPVGTVPTYPYNYRAVDPHSFFADPDPAVFLNADPDPGGKMNADPDPAEQICKK